MNPLAELREGLLIALDAIRANKLRSVLATLGIIIGVLTVTLMATAIDGLNRAFIQGISNLGGDVLSVERQSWFQNSYEDWLEERKRPKLTLAQARVLEREVTLARAVAPVAATHAPVSYRDRGTRQVRVVGTTDQFIHTSGMNIEEGRFLSAAEVEGGRPVCVLGWEMAANLFPGETALGNRIRIGPVRMEVIGVLEKQGGLLGAMGVDNQAVIPIRQLVSNFWNDPECTVQVKALSMETLGETREQVRGVLRTVRRVEPGDADNFSINEQEQFIAVVHRVVAIIASVGLFVTGLSLFVGGIGIMNILFVSVAERTREIGIRKAIGARRRTILLQFLLEAVTVCLLGGLIALALAWPATRLMEGFFPARLSPPIIVLALSVSVSVGLLSGFVPAWRAARMNPVDALRNE